MTLRSPLAVATSPSDAATSTSDSRLPASPDVGPQVSGDEQPTLNADPISIRSLALSLLAAAAVILMLRYMQEVFIPFVLSALLFYTLDPFVDRLSRLLPRVVAAALVLGAVLASLGAGAYALSDDAMAVIDDLPSAARKLRTSLSSLRNDGTVSGQGALEKVQEAAKEVERAAAETMGKDAAAPRGVMRVQVDEPAFRASDYLIAGSWNALSLVGSAAMIAFLTYFLLVTDDLFKRKLVELSGPTLSHKKITVQLLDEIAVQIERFLLVQVFTSFVVGIATWAALWWLGVDDPAFWGLIAGIFNSVPYFGPVIVTAGLSLVAFLQFGTLTMAAWVAGAALIITSLEGWLLTPVLMGRVAQMNQVAIFGGLLFWSWTWGVPGMLLAVPMMMVIKSVCDRIDGLQPIGKFLGD